MKGATICSGIGAPEQAMPWVDWQWSAEIEPFPCAVLKKQHPRSVNLGDVTAKDFIARALEFGRIDVLVAGTPCQDLSVAGKRAGLAGERSGLFFRLMEIVAAINPKWIIFENVPGLLSSNGGADFIAVLDHFDSARYVIDVDILNAQYFGLAQRRERVFIVCEHVDHLLTSRTPSSGLTIAQCLLEISALVLAAAEIPSNRDSFEWDFNATNVKDSVLRRIKLFSLDDTAQASILAENLAAIPTLSDFAPEDSGLPHGSGRTRTATDTRSRKSGKAKETIAGFQNTGRLLKKQLEESLPMLSVFTTSTSESEITESTIYTFSQLTLSITRLIVQSDCLSPSFWSAASSCSIALKGYINYARAATSSLFTELGWLQPWADFLQEALRANDLIGSLRDRADSAEILRFSKGLRRNTEASREAREGPTHPVAPSLTGSGRGVERGGAIAGAKIPSSPVSLAPNVPRAARKTTTVFGVIAAKDSGRRVMAGNSQKSASPSTPKGGQVE